MKELNIRGGNAFILVFDLTKEDSVKSVMSLRKNIIDLKGIENIPIVVVGNKKDLVDESFAYLNLSKKVSKLAIEEFNCIYVETSAKNNYNINETFNSVVDLIHKDICEYKDSKEQSANTSRRNSSLSFVRHMSISNLEKRLSVSRRFSEPASAELSCKSNKRNNSKLIEAVIEKRELEKKCSKKAHQKNCIIS
jgi:GTPase SAR1 family protein